MNLSIVLVSVLAGLVTWVFMYLDARLFDTPKSKFTYFKGIVFVAAVAGLTVYFMGPSRVQVGGLGGLGGPALQHAGTTLVSGIGEEILTGMPNF